MNVLFLLAGAVCCADAALKPFPVLRPVPAYLEDEHRMFQSAPSVTVTPGGRLWCAWHTGGENEGEDNCTVIVSSGDGGRTWTKPLFAIDAPGPLRVLDPGLWTDPDGKVWFFYSQVYDFWDGRAGVWAMHPTDPEDAESAWSPARRLCDGYLKNKPLVKKDGTWLLPVEFMHAEPMSWNLGKGDSVPMTGPQAHPDPSKTTGANVFVSTDKGAHVSFLGQALIPPKARQYPEPMFVEMKDGRLRLFARTAYGIGEAFSRDGGRTWTEVAPSKIKNTSGRFFMGRLASGALLLVKNGPIDQQVGRNRIMAYVSDDDGDTWTGGLVLDERKEVSYPDVAQGRDGAIHIVHDRERRGAQEIIHHVVTEADVRAGRLVTAGSRLKDVVNKCLALPLAVSDATVEKIEGYGVGPVVLTCPEPGGWTFTTSRTAEADGTETMTVSLESPTDAAPPKFSIAFGLPQKDMCFFWQPSSPYCNVVGDWSGAKSSNIAAWAPVYSIFNANERNRFAFACSESQRVLNVRCGIHEADCTFAWRVDFFTAPEAPLSRYTVKIRFDARDVFWGDAVAAASDWILAARGEKPCRTPESAFDPLYSTWYAFHHDVTDANVSAELALAAKLGMKTVILDDGWQSDDDKRGYSWCGDWQASKQHFPDMAAHVAKAHALGMKYMVWYSMPFMGRQAANNARFKGKFLNREPVIGSDILDPRFPEVRAFLVDLYEQALDDWKLDGFKLDFIDQFKFHGTDPAIAEDYAGRDVKCLSEAVDLLLRDVMARLKAKRPDLLVEFRQAYMGPAIRKYGNMIRVGDCPGSILANRVGIASLRLTSNGSAVHSDMLEWHPDETAESAARTILNCLYGVIQYSVRLGTLPESHHRMTAHWLKFSQEHRGALLKGVFRPHHPEALYPVLEGEDARERVLTAYTAGIVVDCGKADKDVLVVNATGRKGLTLRLSAVPAKVEAFDTFGNPVPIARPTTAGVQDVAVPESGYVRMEW